MQITTATIEAHGGTKVANEDQSLKMLQDNDEVFSPLLYLKVVEKSVKKAQEEREDNEWSVKRASPHFYTAS